MGVRNLKGMAFCVNLTFCDLLLSLLVCSPGFTGYYCEVNIDDCGSLPCHHHSTCIDLVNNYTCQCGPRWTGYHCDIYLGSPCNESNNNNMEICQNGGICHETVDKNNYTCICTTGYTGRNCESKTSPCDSSPCEHGGICSVFLDDFKCTCPQGKTMRKSFCCTALGFN